MKKKQNRIMKYKDVGVKRYFDPSDTELLRALHSRNSIKRKNKKNDMRKARACDQ